VTVAVTTPTGHVGSHVVRMLCLAGVRPRVLLRDPGRLDVELRDHVELAVGDQRDRDYVLEATRGADAVFWAHPDDWSMPDPDADAERTGEGLAEAMRENRIARVVFQSSSERSCDTARASLTASPGSRRVWTQPARTPAAHCSICAAGTS
jgi:uncharacterized protein YbjT (DUF2867 family)